MRNLHWLLTISTSSWVVTPWFNDQWLEEVQILQEIIHWMKERLVRLNFTTDSVMLDSFSQPHLAKNVFRVLVPVGWTGKNISEYLVRREENLRTTSWSLMCRRLTNLAFWAHPEIGLGYHWKDDNGGTCFFKDVCSWDGDYPQKNITKEIMGG